MYLHSLYIQPLICVCTTVMMAYIGWQFMHAIRKFLKVKKKSARLYFVDKGCDVKLGELKRKKCLLLPQELLYVTIIQLFWVVYCIVVANCLPLAWHSFFPSYPYHHSPRSLLLSRHSRGRNCAPSSPSFSLKGTYKQQLINY